MLSDGAGGAPTVAERERGLQRLGDVSLFVAGFFAHSFARKLIDIDYHIAMGGQAYGTLALGLATRVASAKCSAACSLSCRPSFRTPMPWSMRWARSPTRPGGTRRPTSCGCMKIVQDQAAALSPGFAGSVGRAGHAGGDDAQAIEALRSPRALSRRSRRCSVAAPEGGHGFAGMLQGFTHRYLRSADALLTSMIFSLPNASRYPRGCAIQTLDEQVLVSEAGRCHRRRGIPWMRNPCSIRLTASNPLETLNAANIADYWTALVRESVTFIYLAWNAGPRPRREVCSSELELQAEIDKYVTSRCGCCASRIRRASRPNYTGCCSSAPASTPHWPASAASCIARPINACRQILPSGWSDSPLVAEGARLRREALGEVAALSSAEPRRTR